VAYIGVFFAPLCGIQIIDYFLLRRQRVSIRGLYAKGPDAPYGYWFGINPAALAGMAVGVWAYLYLLDPISYEIRDPFTLVGASLPAAILAAVAYAIVTLVVIRPLNKGGYRS
jgi:NCS1 family nucleobase:cation symporter-1